MNRARGFTLVELLVTMTVASILLAWGIPNLQLTLAANRLATQTNNFTTALALARSEAMQLGVPVTLCKSANGTSCAATGGYQQGWIVFAENTGAAPGAFNASAVTYAAGAVSNLPIRRANGSVLAAGTPVPAGGITSAPDQILATGLPISGGNTLTGNNNISNRITFDSQGMTMMLGTFTVCDAKRDGHERRIVVNMTGRAELQRSDGDGAASC